MKEEKRDSILDRFRSVEIDPEVCNGCNTCVDIYIMDVLVANKEQGKPPMVVYPHEMLL